MLVSGEVALARRKLLCPGQSSIGSWDEPATKTRQRHMEQRAVSTQQEAAEGED